MTVAKEKFKVVMRSWSGRQRTLEAGLSMKEAMDICKKHGWEYRENGMVWGLSIEEE